METSKINFEVQKRYFLCGQKKDNLDGHQLCQSTFIMEVYHWPIGEVVFSSQTYDLEGYAPYRIQDMLPIPLTSSDKGDSHRNYRPYV